MKKQIVMMAVAMMTWAGGATSAVAAVEGSSTMSAREDNRWGGNLAIGRPFPQVLGFNVSYNVNDKIRAQMGHGSMSVASSMSFDGNGITVSEAKLETIGLGAEYFLTDWAFRPTLGMSISHNQYSGPEGGLTLNGVGKSGTLLVASGGFDYQSQGGFNLGLGIQQVVAGNSAGGNFYLAGGYFF